jgi:hypothetical protein
VCRSCEINVSSFVVESSSHVTRGTCCEPNLSVVNLVKL